MSTHINDLRWSTALATGVYPSTVVASTHGPTVDLGAINGDGPSFAIQHIGALEEDGTLDGRIEQSADGNSWSAISGAAFAQVSASNDLQTIRFMRAMRYIRWAATIAGSSPIFSIGVLFGSQKKTF